MKGCADVRDMIHPFVDGELEVTDNVTLLKHLELCPGCRARCEEERALKELVGSRLQERLSEVERRRVLAGAFGRERRAVWRNRLANAAAVLLVASGAGLGMLVAKDPCLFKPCPTELALKAAVEAARTQQPLSLAQVAEVFPREVCVPKACNLRNEGVFLVAAPGGAERPVVQYRCQKTGTRLAFIHVTSQHRLCFGEAREHTDGRRYVSRAVDGMRAVGWYGKDGELRACLAADDVPDDTLYVMASAVRDGDI